MKDISKKIGKLVALAHHITMTTKADAFAEYSGHVDWFAIRYYENGWHEDMEAKYIMANEKVNFKNVNKAIKELKKLERELKDGTN